MHKTYKVCYEKSFMPFREWHEVNEKEYKFKWYAHFNIWKWIWLDTMLTSYVLHRAKINNELITVGWYDKN